MMTLSPFARRQLLNVVMVGNAIRPLPGFRAGVPSFFASWLVGELAPHGILLTSADVAGQLARGRRDRVGLALAGASLLGLAHLVRRAQQSRHVLDEALSSDLGEAWVEQMDAEHDETDLGTPWRQLVLPFFYDWSDIDVVKDVPYSPETGKRGLLDVYRPREMPESDGPLPVLLQVHGGAWTIGTKDQQGLPLMWHMAPRGWVCVAINYRLSPRDTFPAQVVDVKKAIAWIKQHITDYGGDPSYIAITGGSAGGHLAALAALTANDPEYQPGFEDADTTVQAAIPFYGVYDFAGLTRARNVERLRDIFLAKRVLKKDPVADRDDFVRASPIARVHADAPDFFIVHGVHDTLVPLDHAREFAQALRDISKRSVVYAELPGTQHAFEVFPSVRSAHMVRAVERYLAWHRSTTAAERVAVTG